MENDVLGVIKYYYGFAASRAKKIEGYDGTIFLIEVDEESTNTKYIVKLYEGDDLEEELTKMQHTTLRHLKEKGFVASFPIETKNKESTVSCKFGETKYVMQILTFLEGRSVNEAVQHEKELSELCYNTGKYVAQMHIALMDLQCADIRRTKDRCWYADESHLAEEHIDFVENDYVKQVLKKYIDGYKTRVLPLLSELRRGIVHGDASDTNILVTVQHTSDDDMKHQIAGVIDFGDSSYSCYVGCLAVCVTYFMMKSVSLPNGNPVDNAKKIIQGYQSMLLLTSTEKDLLLDFVLARLAVSYIEGRYQLKLNPENRDTILLQSKHIPKLVDIIESVGKDAIQSAWFS